MTYLSIRVHFHSSVYLFIQLREEDINNLKQDSVRLARQREIIQRKYRGVEEQKIEFEHQKETLKGQISALERGREMFALIV